MIVALEYVTHTYVNYASSANILLCEVNSEEEAFAEMRRFLEINRISSNTTNVKMVESHEHVGRIVPRHKEVYMSLNGRPPYDRSKNKYIESVTFGIYYGSDRPRYEKLGAIEDWGLCEEKDWKTGEIKLVRKGHRIAEITSGEWYNCVKRYIDDLAVRKAGGR